MPKEKKSGLTLHLQRYLIAGIITVIPIWITWLIFNFIVKQLSKVGMPWARALSKAIEQYVPDLAKWVLEPWFINTLAIILTLAGLYLLGWFASRVVGKKLLNTFDLLMERIPFIQTVYGATKKLLAVLQQKPEKLHRVVLIQFPSPEMKTVGFVTRTLTDHATGKELAAVYVPTTPNPTSGYLEVVPVENLVSTDWTIEEAMTFIISGGAVAPDNIHYTASHSPPANDESPAPGRKPDGSTPQGHR